MGHPSLYPKGYTKAILLNRMVQHLWVAIILPLTPWIPLRTNQRSLDNPPRLYCIWLYVNDLNMNKSDSNVHDAPPKLFRLSLLTNFSGWYWLINNNGWQRQRPQWPTIINTKCQVVEIQWEPINFLVITSFGNGTKIITFTLWSYLPPGDHRSPLPC